MANRAAYLPAYVGRVLSGGAAPVLAYPEAASQTFVKGDLVFISSGYLTICGSDPTAILGIALDDAHNTTAGLYQINVSLITPWTLVTMSVGHATAGNDKIEAADMGTLYGVVSVSAGIWRVDKEDTTATRVRIMNFIDEVGATKGRVGCLFFTTNSRTWL
jgi:hypothetical protein